jgi:1-phosphofructokinase family hexose kinase
MIIAVTPNVSLDRTLVLPRLKNGSVLRATTVLGGAGGKGVVACYAAKAIGGEALCMGFLGGVNGEQVRAYAVRDDIATRWTTVAGETRVTTVIRDETTGEVTVINEPGPQVDAGDWARLGTDVVVAACETGARHIAFCGSLPAGSPMSSYGDLLGGLRDAGLAVWVDASGAALETAAALAGIALKVNDDEIGALLGQKIGTVDEAAQAAEALTAQRGAATVVTLGAQGAVYADGRAVLLAQPPPVQIVSAVGSGDSFLAGLLLGLDAGEDSRTALWWGIAAGTANALSLGAGRFTRAEYEAVRG